MILLRKNNNVCEQNTKYSCTGVVVGEYRLFCILVEGLCFGVSLLMGAKLVCNLNCAILSSCYGVLQYSNTVLVQKIQILERSWIGKGCQ